MNIPYNPTRLFTFGCSYTSWSWPTWADILGAELQRRGDCEVHNFGEGGAGNQFIAQQISMVDLTHNFTKDDLVIVCWSEIFREDRYIENTPGYSDGWVLAGGIQDASIYPLDKLAKITGPMHVGIRDYSLMYYVNSLLEKTTTRYISKFDFSKYNAIVDNIFPEKSNDFLELTNIFKTATKNIQHSFEELTMAPRRKSLSKEFLDLHPFPLDHLTFLTDICDIEISSDIKEEVYNAQDALYEMINVYLADISHPLEDIVKYNGDSLTLLAYTYKKHNLMSTRARELPF